MTRSSDESCEWDGCTREWTKTAGGRRLCTDHHNEMMERQLFRGGFY